MLAKNDNNKDKFGVSVTKALKIVNISLRQNAEL